MGTRNDDISLKLAKAVKAGFLPDIYDSEVDILTKEAQSLFGTDSFIPFQPLTANKGKILVLGTSIAAAVGATNASFAYPARIAANLVALTGQNIWTAIAAGVSGNTTTEMLVRLPALLNTHNPEYVTIEVSVNNTRTDRSYTTAQTIADVQAMIDLTKAAGAIPVLISSSPFDPAWWNSVYDFGSAQEAVDSNVAAKSLASTQKILFVDLFPLFNGRVGVLFDGLHPNNAGHDIYGKAIAEAIRLNANTLTQTTAVSDSFNRADSVAGVGSADIGGVWVQSVANSWGINGNRAYIAANTQYSLMGIDTGKTNICVKATTAAAIGFGVYARGIDGANYYVAEISSARIATIWKRVAGVFTILYQSPAAVAPSLSVGDTLAFTVEGTHLSAALNGRVVAAVTDATHTTGTVAGMWNAGNAPYIDSAVITT